MISISTKRDALLYAPHRRKAVSWRDGVGWCQTYCTACMCIFVHATHKLWNVDIFRDLFAYHCLDIKRKWQKNKQNPYNLFIIWQRQQEEQQQQQQQEHSNAYSLSFFFFCISTHPETIFQLIFKHIFLNSFWCHWHVYHFCPFLLWNWRIYCSYCTP